MEMGGRWGDSREGETNGRGWGEEGTKRRRVASEGGISASPHYLRLLTGGAAGPADWP